MKKVFLILMVLPIFNVLNAQEIGLRFGEMAGNNIAIDGVLNLKEARLHGDVTFGRGIGVDVVYDFLYKPIVSIPQLKYYLGVGFTTLFQSDYEIGASGEIGIEYRFQKAPLTLSLDYRPSIIVLQSSDFHWNGFGINFRYIIDH